mmetsp:Transcript_2433/g.3447  ORF Transcript_2433/g.3447 Transcript_2433/m.3447 type:complete len:290 (+) Transcript_2433:149-1018(+)
MFYQFEKTRFKVALLIIDPQNDFHEGGSLAVPGAQNDSKRITELIRTKGDFIDQIYVTLDSHHPQHIATPSFWKNKRNKHPSPFTVISNADILEGKWTPVDSNLLPHCILYTEQLESEGRFQLVVWPEHCLIGTQGHAVTQVLSNMLQEWSKKYSKSVKYIQKGQNCLTEMYSALKAEVVISNDPSTALNIDLIKELKSYDKLFVCGQALSHCVNYTVRDLVDEMSERQINNLVIFSDASSCVPSYEQDGQDFIHDIILKGGAVGVTTQFDEYIDLPPRACPGVWCSIM